MNKIKLVIAALIVMATAFVATAPVYAVDGAAQTAVCSGIGLTSESGDCKGDGVTVPSVVHSVISIMSYLIGIIAVIMIIVASFKYVTAGGDSNRVGSAKSTLMYALIGLVIAALAQVLVIFVFTQTSKSKENIDPVQSGSHQSASPTIDPVQGGSHTTP